MRPNYPLSIMCIEKKEETINSITSILESDTFNLTQDKEFFFIKDLEEASSIHDQLFSVRKAPDMIFVSSEFLTSSDELSLVTRMTKIDNEVHVILIHHENNSLEYAPSVFKGVSNTPLTIDNVNEHIQNYFKSFVDRKTAEYFQSIKERMKWER